MIDKPSLFFILNVAQYELIERIMKSNAKRKTWQDGLQNIAGG
jgi:hypothetical protein